MTLRAVDRTAVAAQDSVEPILTTNARKVLEARYLKKNEHGDCVERPSDLFRRVAHTIADVETHYGASALERQQWEDRFYNLMTSGRFMPNSPTLMNAGREMGMLSACFVLPVRDSIVDIFNSIKHTALIQKAGGGTGFAFDELRPTGDFIASSGGTTSGPISFWKAFSEATNAIQQGAFRRGANMGMMYIHHPDIVKFLHAKQDLTQFTNYNISVKVTDAWMEEFLADPDSPHVVRNPRTGKSFVIPADVDVWKYDVRNLVEVTCVEPVSPVSREKYFRSPRLRGQIPEALRGKVYTKRQIWDIIIDNAWQTGEPGVVFIDRINEANPTPHVGRIEATNPCGEQPLLPYEACNLGSINLGLFVRNSGTPQADVDWDALRESVHESVRFLDNVIDANNYPLPEIDQICKSNRKIGLGIMGFADALYKLNAAYNSEEGVAWGERFMRFVNDAAHDYSEHLARTRGCFTNWKGSTWHTKHNRLMRNACTTTVAPTGTISIIANCSGGIEPMFSLAFLRNVLRGQKQGEKPLIEVNDVFVQVARAGGFYSDELVERVARDGTLAHMDGVPAEVKRVFVCAHDITPEWHMRMQAAFQRHCDSSISKTINFAHDSNRDDVAEIYRLAFELRCKGVTVYRDGCRNFQPMALKKEEGAAAKQTEALIEAKSVPGGGASKEGAVAAAARSAEAAQDAVVAPLAENLAVAGAPNGNGNGRGSNGRAPGADTTPRDARPEALDARAALPAVPAPSFADQLRSADVMPAAAPAGGSSLPPARTIEPLDLPEIVSGLRIRQMTPFGNMHVKITVDPRTDRELEVFAQLGKGGDVATSDLEAICRMISLWLRAGGSLRLVIKQLEGIGSSLQIPTRAGRIMSLGDGLACALKKYVRAKERFGLRGLLLGEVDLSQLDAPRPPHAAAAAMPRGVEPASALRSEEIAGADRSMMQPGDDADGPLSARATSDRLAIGRTDRDAVLHAGGDRNGGARGGGKPASPERIGEVAPAGARSARGRSSVASRLSVDGEAAARVERGNGSLTALLDSPVEDPAADPIFGDTLLDAELAQAAVATDLLEADPFGGRAGFDQKLAGANAIISLESIEEADTLEMVESTTITVEGVTTEVFARHTHDAAPHYKLHCPECDAIVARQEGCLKCYACGWSAC